MLTPIHVETTVVASVLVFALFTTVVQFCVLLLASTRMLQTHPGPVKLASPPVYMLLTPAVATYSTNVILERLSCMYVPAAIPESYATSQPHESREYAVVGHDTWLARVAVTAYCVVAGLTSAVPRFPIPAVENEFAGHSKHLLDGPSEENVLAGHTEQADEPCML